MPCDQRSWRVHDRVYNNNNTLTTVTMVNLEKLTLNYITNQSGDKTAVILPIKEFEELLEDIEDLAIVVERIKEPTTTHKDLLAELKKDGIL